MNKLLLLSLLVCLQWHFVSAQGDTLELAELLEQARLQAPAVQQAEAELQQSQWQWKAYRANLLPQFSLLGTLPNYSRTFSPVTQPDGSLQFQPVVNQNSSLSLEVSQEVGLTGGSFFLVSQLQRFDDFERKYTQYSSSPLTIGYRQTIFGFNPQSWNRRIEPLKRQAAERNILTQREASALDAGLRFFNLLLAQLDTDMARQNAAHGEKILEIARLRYELGRLSENDVLQLEYGLMNARRALMGAQQVQESAALEMAAYLGIPWGSITYVKSPEAPPRLELSPDKAIEEARQNRESWLEFEIRLLEAQRNRQEVKRTNGFSADFYAAVGLADRSENLPEAYQNPVDQQLVSLGFRIPLVDWGRGRARLRTAEAAQELTQLRIDEEKRAFEQDVRQEVQSWGYLSEQLTFARQAAHLAERRYAIARESFALGRISITELSLAQNEKDSAQRAYLQSLRDAWITHLRLRLLTLYDFEQNRPIQQEESR